MLVGRTIFQTKNPSHCYVHFGIYGVRSNFKQTHIWFDSAMPLDKFQSTSLHFGALDRAGHCSSPDLHRSSMPWVYIDGGCDMKYLGHLGTWDFPKYSEMSRVEMSQVEHTEGTGDVIQHRVTCHFAASWLPSSSPASVSNQTTFGAFVNGVRNIRKGQARTETYGETLCKMSTGQPHGHF